MVTLEGGPDRHNVRPKVGPATPEAMTPRDAAPRRRTRWRKRLSISLAVVVLLLAATELFTRFCLGLGDPPLSMTDPATGYLSQPNQTCHRFGHLIHYNAYSMRSDDFPAHKSSPDEFRVMVIGNSIINGGTPTDQSQVCTTLLQDELPAKLHRPVVVGNISAGGWGPLSEWGYVKARGFFDADALVIVISSNDIRLPFPDYPVVGKDVSFPDHKPWSTTWECFSRYGPRYLPFMHGMAGSNEGYHPGVEDATLTAQCLEAVQNMIAGAKQSGAKVYVILHCTRPELVKMRADPRWRPEPFRQVQAASAAAGATAICTDSTDAQPTDYREDIHINAQGQRHLAALMLRLIEP
jgi:hypothetical protein